METQPHSDSLSEETPAPDPETKKRRRVPLWATVVGGLVAGVLVLAVVGRLTGTSDDPLVPETLTPPASDPGQSAAQACLGGTENLNDAVLTAQAEAPITETGAAEFATTYMRWTINGEQPLDPTVLASVSSPSMAEDLSASDPTDSTGAAHAEVTERDFYMVQDFTESSTRVTVSLTLDSGGDQIPFWWTLGLVTDNTGRWIVGGFLNNPATDYTGAGATSQDAVMAGYMKKFDELSTVGNQFEGACS